MKILVLAAMDSEIETLIGSNKSHGKLAHLYPYFTSPINSNTIICKTHVGPHHANLATSLAISELHPDLVIKFGCVGGASQHIHRGDIVLPEAYFHNSAWITKKQDGSVSSNINDWINLYGESDYQVTSANLSNISPRINQDTALKSKLELILKEHDVPYNSAYVGSGSVWYFGEDNNNKVSQVFLEKNSVTQTWVADMESYQVSFVCQVLQIPFLGLYAVSSSDFYGEEYNPDIVTDLLNNKLKAIFTSLIRDMG